MELNPAQKKAIHDIDGPLLVLAGAGSGKTRVITQKIVYLIRDCGRMAGTIAALTFTNKAAKEMLSRISELLDKKERKGLHVSTFHTLGLTMLKQDADLVGLRKGFSLFDTEDCLNILKSLLPKYAQDKIFLQQLQMQLSNWKNALLEPHQVSYDDLKHEVAEVAYGIYAEYEDTLRSYNACDFDDLILLPVKLLENNHQVLAKWRNKFHYMLIDEYQDTNASQYRLVCLLMEERQRFTVVGDDDQSIYAWRGAMPENLSLIKKDFPSLKVIKLEQNYRSSGCILACANHLIAFNAHLFEKKLWSQLGFGERVKILRVADEFTEAEQVVYEIISHQLRHKTEFSDYAILYRGNHQSRLFEKALRDKTIPYNLSGGQSFFSKGEIKDILAYLRLMTNEEDDSAFLRIINTPKRGIGKTTMRALTDFAAEKECCLFRACQALALKSHVSEKSFERLCQFHQMIEAQKTNFESGMPLLNGLKKLVSVIGYEQYIYDLYDEASVAKRKIENVFDLLSWIEKLSTPDENTTLTLSEILQKLLLIDVLGKEKEDNDGVELMTLHAAKGLEFPHVYLVGMEEELLPHKTSIDEGNIEEERRLAYVGITRARKTLTLTLTHKRNRYGELVDSIPSRFLEELPENGIEWVGGKNKDKVNDKQGGKKHLSLLKQMLAKDS